MKKVFSREKFLAYEFISSPDDIEMDIAAHWPFECDGKTPAECSPYIIEDDWMEEREDTNE